MRRRATASLLDIAQDRGLAAKDPTARRAGAAARQSGREFEDAIDAVNRWYDAHGEALIEKVNPPVHGWGASLRVGASSVDYVGTMYWPLLKGHVGIAFDAKVITGEATFKAPDAKLSEGRARSRFFAQVQYLRGASVRHGYIAGFFLYCRDLETAWWCGSEHFDTLGAGGGVAVRTIARTKASKGAITHHLPSIAAPLGLAAIPQLATKRPLLDYLSLIVSA